MKKIKNNYFDILQRLGRSFMLPIAILPIAGLLLGIGTCLTNEAVIELYGLDSLLGEGSVLSGLFTIMASTGHVIFDNLPILFAIGVAIGMSKDSKEFAAMASVVAYLIMNSSINACLVIAGQVSSDGTATSQMMKSMITDVLGITTFQMGAFGGIIVGIGVAWLNNHFNRTVLPTALSFFEGNRFVIIISTLVYMFVGILLFLVWPTIETAIYSIGNYVVISGYAGTFVYGFIKRMLIPFGLHHVFYFPFWQTAIGGSMTIGGQVVNGAQNIFFAQLADPSTASYSVEACRFFTGEFIFMIFGLPGAALAIYQTAEASQKKKVAGLMLSAAIASIFTGITEPIEFSFMFASPVLYLVHCILSGLAYMIAHILRITVGLTFSGGFIDFFLFGILQGESKTRWMLLIPVGIIYFAVYYLVFRAMILNFNLKTPGRDETGISTNIKTADHDFEIAEPALDETEQMDYLISGLGGIHNIEAVDSCATRLRCTLYNENLASIPFIERSGSFGILKAQNNIQIIYGPKVGQIKRKLQSIMEENKKQQMEGPDMIFAFANGQLIPMDSVDDIVFSSGLLGDGFAILPTDDTIYSPADGTVTMVADTKHAIGITSERGAVLLIHLGIDTVRLQGSGFEVFVQTGQKVRSGDLLASFDRKYVLERGYSVTCPLIISNSDDYKNISSVKGAHVGVGDGVMTISRE